MTYVSSTEYFWNGPAAGEKERVKNMSQDSISANNSLKVGLPTESLDGKQQEEGGYK